MSGLELATRLLHLNRGDYTFAVAAQHSSDADDTDDTDDLETVA
jgi:4-hydroxyacetophenone monooxygenase